MIVRELITRLGYRLDEAGARRAEQATTRIKDGAERAADAVRNVLVGLASAATVMQLVGVADEMQNIRARLGALPQTVGEVGAAFDMVADRASAAGVTIEAYSGLYTKVGMAAKDYIATQEDLLGVTDTISKALVVGGASGQEASAVMTQFAQALASGVLQGDEFRSMAEAAPQYLDQLSLAMKIPREQLKKMASDGKLTARAVIAATRDMSDYFEDRFNKMPMTVGRATVVVGNRFKKMIDRMNRESGAITAIAEFMVWALGEIEGGVGKLVDKLGGLDNALRLLGIAFAVAFGAKTLQLLAAFKLASLAALWPYLRMAVIIAAVTLVIEDLYVWIEGGNSVIGQALGPWTQYRDTAQEVWDKIKELGPEFKKLAEFVAISTAAFIALEAGLALARGAVILWNGLVIIATALQTAWNLAMSLNPIALIIIGIAALVAAGVWLVANWETVKDWFSSLFTWLAEKFNWVADKLGFFGTLAKGLVNPLGMAAEFAGGGGGRKVTPGQMTAQGQGAARPNVTNTTNVALTVPPGTSKEQAAFVKRSADAAFAKPSTKLARDISNRGGR